MKTFSSRLIALRKERQMTQSNLAKAIHKTRSTVSGYETEGKEPDYETLCSLAEYFGVSTDYLLGIDDCRTHSEAVFINDTRNFKRHYDNLPPLIKQTAAKMYDSFYVLLSCDMMKNDEECLELYSDLFSLLQDSRAKIHNVIDSCDGQVTDPLLLSDLINLQNSLKNKLCTILDKLLQVDIDRAFEVKKEDTKYSEQKDVLDYIRFKKCRRPEAKGLKELDTEIMEQNISRAAFTPSVPDFTDESEEFMNKKNSPSKD